MYESPGSLQDVCLDYISGNINAICELQTNLDDGHASYVFNSDVYIPSNLSDRLIISLGNRRQLTDETLSLFHPERTNLKRVKIRNSPLTLKSLRLLRAHKILELEATGLKSVTVNDLIGCLGEWSLTHLRWLNVAKSTFMNSAQFRLVVSLSRLKSLQSLNVSDTEFTEHGLEIIVEDLPSLENLDISNTLVSDICSLRKCKDRLKYLSMYKLRTSSNETVVAVLRDLHNLRHLDVSDGFNVQPFIGMHHGKFSIHALMKGNCFPHMTSLDISGKEGITEVILCDFLSSHPKLQFLGLALTDACELPMFCNCDDESSPYSEPDFKVSGEATEIQLVESLNRYASRATYIQRSLFNLFHRTQQYTQPKLDIMKLILSSMKNHPKELGVQMAATACLYNLTKGEMGQKTHPRWLSQIVTLTMDAMNNFPNHQQLQKNALLTLCSDRILQEVTFDRFHCGQLVMDCLCAFDDSSMNRMSVAICGILAAKIPTDQTSKLGAKTIYMQKLLTIVRQRTEQHIVDTTMKFTLSALWNLTDESPQTCKMFVNEGGLSLFMKALERYSSQPDDRRTQVETKVLGLINNLAEVRDLRPELMRAEILKPIRDLLHSNHIDVSYFAAGIISHLVSDEWDTWNVEGLDRDEILDNLGNAVMEWKQPQGEMVAYRSFTPFFPLLRHHDAFQVQLWAVWAMKHVCTKNASRYCSMLVSEDGAKLLEELVDTSTTVLKVRQLAKSVLDMIDSELGSNWRQ